MAEGVGKDVPLPGDGGVDENDPGHGGHDAVIEDVEPTGAAHPAEAAIKDEEPDKTEPEDRHGIAEESDDAEHLIGPAVLVGRRQYAGRNAERHADADGDRREFERCGKDPHQVGQHRLRGQHRHPEIAGEQALEVDEVLDDRRLIESKLEEYPVVGHLVCPVPDDGDDRVDVGEPADEEGDGGKPDKGDDQREEEREHAPDQRADPAMAARRGARFRGSADAHSAAPVPASSRGARAQHSRAGIASLVSAARATSGV